VLSILYIPAKSRREGLREGASEKGALKGGGGGGAVAVPGLVVFLRATPKDPATRRSAHECSAECNTSGTGCSSASVAVGGCRVRCCGGALFGIWLEDPPRILPLLTEEENGLSMTAEAS
jgi:hypothetical protein